jgi:hypothetical protein
LNRRLSLGFANDHAHGALASIPISVVNFLSPFVNYCYRLAISGIAIFTLLTQGIALYSSELAPHVA